MNNAAIKITKICAVISTIALYGCGSDSHTVSNDEQVVPSIPDVVEVVPPVSIAEWQLVWSDEFNEAQIDQTKWTYEVNCFGGGNNEKQCYTEDESNSFIADGKLNIVALPATDANAEQPYTSARMISRHKADFKYGRFEMHAKLPSGQGSWPAFWLLPTDDIYGGWPRSGEIDIVEAVNLKTVNDENIEEANVHGTLHYGKAWPNNSSSGKAYSFLDSMNPADDFHTYAIEWQEGEIRWYIDGVLYEVQRQSVVRTNSDDEVIGLSHRGWFAEYFDTEVGGLTTHWDSSPFDQRFFMILNYAVGGDWPSNVNNTGIDANAFVSSNSFEIDYIRVYECSIDTETGKGCDTISSGSISIDDALENGKAPIPLPPSTGIAEDLTIFDGTLNPNWPIWNCCGEITPTVVADSDNGDVIQFGVGATATVNGFISREEFIVDDAGVPTPFDASPIISDGIVSFDMKVISPPADSTAKWIVKIESIEATTDVDVEITASNEGVLPVTGEWQTYTFPLQMLANGGLDLNSIDVVMIFPTWGLGEGAVYQVTNLTITSDGSASDSDAGTGSISDPLSLTVFENEENTSWPAWDCCGGLLPTIETEDNDHEQVTEFSIGTQPTVMGFISRDEFIKIDGVSAAPFDASAILNDGVISFDMRVISSPNVTDTPWLFKVESNGGETPVELMLTQSNEGVAPTLDIWQTYTFNLSDLANAGLDISAIDVLMVFPTWGEGEGAIYRLDNVKIVTP